MFEWSEKLFNSTPDPVKVCEVYKDKANGSCDHVDGPLCNYETCSSVKFYKEFKENKLK